MGKVYSLHKNVHEEQTKFLRISFVRSIAQQSVDSEVSSTGFSEKFADVWSGPTNGEVQWVVKDVDALALACFPSSIAINILSSEVYITIDVGGH